MMDTKRGKERKCSTWLAAAAAVVACSLAGGPATAWAYVQNPPLDEACGLDVVLMMDECSSISSSEFALMQAAFVGFVEALNVTPTEFALVDFGTVAYPREDFQSDGAILAAINAARLSGTQYTNWQQASGLRPAGVRVD